MKYYLGIDVGSISTKGVIIDSNEKLIAYEYLWTEGNPINAVKEVIKNLYSKIKDKNIKVSSVGTTGSARKLIGVMLSASVVKNEITAHAIGCLSRHKEVRTILEIGGQDSKIILINKGIVSDYAMNTLCAAGTGAFLTSQAKRLGIRIEDFGNIALQSKKPAKVAARCTVFAESDLVHKLQIGYEKCDIVAGLCNAVVNNYLNNVGKGKKILGPILFVGGVSKNSGVVKAFETSLNKQVIVDEYGHLMGAIGIAIIAKNSGFETLFNSDTIKIEFETKGIECIKCSNKCDIIHVLKNKKLIDSFGNRCENGIAKDYLLNNSL